MSELTRRIPLLSFAAAALVVATAPRARAQFEGTVTMRMTTPEGKASDMAYSVKGDRVRMDMSAMGANVFMLRDGDKMSIVMPAQRMYLDQSITAAARSAGAGKTPVKPQDITMTGRKETIAGYECEHATITGDDGKYDVCLAKGLGTFFMPNNPLAGRGGSSGGPGSAVLAKLGGEVFPLKVQKVGDANPILEVTKIDKKPLDAAMFTVPSDYRKMDFGAMMGGRPPFGI